MQATEEKEAAEAKAAAKKVAAACGARAVLDAAVAAHHVARQLLDNARMAERKAPACDAVKAARVAAEQSLAKAKTAMDAASITFGDLSLRVSEGDDDGNGGGAAPEEHGGGAEGPALEPGHPKLWDFEKPLMLTEVTMMQIQRLWLILDKNRDQKISVEDFKALAGGAAPPVAPFSAPLSGGVRPIPQSQASGAERRVAADGNSYTLQEFKEYYRGKRGVWEAKWDAAEPIAGASALTDHQQAIDKWQEMSKEFDTDRSEDITPVEFIDVFKKKAMSEALDWEWIKSLPEQTYLDVQAKINESINRRLQNHVKMARAYLAQDAVPPSGGVELSPPWNTKGWKRVSTRSADQLRVNTENLEKIEEIFNHLDQTKDGVLTKDDFRPTTSGEVSLRDGSGSPPFGRRSPPPAPRPPPAARSVRRQACMRVAFESLLSPSDRALRVPRHLTEPL